MSFDDHPHLIPRVLIVSFSAPSPVLPVAMDETSLTFLKIVAKWSVDPVYPYFSTGYSPPNLLSPRFKALEVAVTDITLKVASGDDLTVESVTAEMSRLQSQICRRDGGVHESKSRLCQRDVSVKDLQRELQEWPTSCTG